MDNISLDSHFIKPHSIAGGSVDILTRHPETPYLKRDANCVRPILSFRTQDNTECEILETTDGTCLCDELTKRGIADKVIGKQILICTYDRRALNKPKVENHSGRHKIVHFVTKEFTYCELHVEYPYIVNSKEYVQNSLQKEVLAQEYLNQILQ